MEPGEFRWTGAGWRFLSDHDRNRAYLAESKASQARFDHDKALAGAAEQKRSEIRSGIAKAAAALRPVNELWTPRLRAQHVLIARKADKAPSSYSDSRPRYKFNDLHFRILSPAIQVSTYHSALVSVVKQTSTYDIGVDASGRVVTMWRPQVASSSARPKSGPAAVTWPPRAAEAAHWMYGYRRLVEDPNLDDPEVEGLTGKDLLAIYNHLLGLATERRVHVNAEPIAIRAEDYEQPTSPPPGKHTPQYRQLFEDIVAKLFEVPGVARRRYITDRVRVAPWAKRADWKNWEIRWVELEPVVPLHIDKGGTVGATRAGRLVVYHHLDQVDLPPQRRSDNDGYARLVADPHLLEPRPRGFFPDDPGPSIVDVMQSAVRLCEKHGIRLRWSAHEL